MIDNYDEKFIKKFFEKLIKKCSSKGVYSVAEAVKQLGLDYALVKSWAESNEELMDAIEFCRANCGSNAKKDGWLSKLSIEEMHKYVCENDDEYREFYEEQEYREQLQNNLIEPKERTFMIEDKTQAVAPSEKKEALNNRIKNWQTRKDKNDPLVNFSSTKNEKTIGLIPEMKIEGLTQIEECEIQRAAMCAATGSSNFEYGNLLFSQSVSAFFLRENDPAYIANALNGALTAMNPQDEFEGMLCARLVVLQNQYLHFMSSAASSDATPASIDNNINRATKLMRVHTETLEALVRYRRKGEQKVTVQHQYVNVENGGQAIVGNITRGGGKTKKAKE